MDHRCFYSTLLYPEVKKKIQGNFEQKINLVMHHRGRAFLRRITLSEVI